MNGTLEIGPVPDGEPPDPAVVDDPDARRVDLAADQASDDAAGRLQEVFAGFDLARLRRDAHHQELWTGAFSPGGPLPACVGDLDELVATLTLDPHRIVLSREGATIDIGVVAGERRTRPGAPTMVNPARLVGCLGEGVTVQLAHVDELHAGLGELCADLERVFLGRAKVDIFLSQGETSGLGPHFDNPELFVVQLHGQKRWRFHRPDVEHPQRGLMDEGRALLEGRTDPAGEVVLEPGDAFFLPQGWWHEAVAAGGPSAHATIGVTRPTAHEAVERLVRWGRWSDPGLRAPVDDSWRSADLVSLLADLQDGVDADGWRRWVRGTMAPRAHNRVSLLWALSAGHHVEGAEARGATPGGVVPVRTVDGGLVVWMGGHQVSIGADALPALLEVAGGEWFRVSAVDGGWPAVATLLTAGLVTLRPAPGDDDRGLWQ